MKKIIDENLIVTLGLDKLPADEQEKLLLDIGDVIYDSIITRAIKAMSSKDKIDFEHLLSDNPDFDTLGEFIYTHVPHIDKIAEEEIRDFKKMALDTVQSVMA